EFEVQGQVAPNASIIATYSHLHMRDALGRMVRAVADNNASLLYNYRIGEGSLNHLSLFAGVTYSGRRAGDIPGVNFTPLGVVAQVSFYLKPKSNTTIGASYELDKRYIFRLTIDNVLDDKDYIAVAGGRVSGTGLTTAPGTNVRFSTTVKF